MNIVQKENRLKGVPDAVLQQMAQQMAQSGDISNPNFLLVSGELQARKNIRQKAAIGQGNPASVISDLLTGGAMPPQMGQQAPQQMAQAPAEGGLAAMRAPSAEEEFADGGLVAFQAGGNPLIEILNQMTLQERQQYQRTGVLPPKYQQQLNLSLPSPAIDYTKADPTLAMGVATDPGVPSQSLAGMSQQPPSSPPPKALAEQPRSLVGGIDALARAKELTGTDVGLYKDLGDEKDFMKARAAERKALGDVFKSQEEALQKSINRIPGLEKQYDAAILLKAAAALGSTPGSFLQGLTAAGGAVAGDVMAKAEKLTSVQDKIDERQAQIEADRIRLERADTDKDRNEFARRLEKREAGLQALALTQAKIRGDLENTMLNVQSREKLGQLQLEASQLERQVGREEARRSVALKEANDTIEKEIAALGPLAQPAKIMELEAKRDTLFNTYLNMLDDKRTSNAATSPPNLAAEARKELERRQGLK